MQEPLQLSYVITKVDLKAELWADNAEVIRRVTATDVPAEALDYDLHMTTQQWIGLIGYDLQCFDSHIEQKLQENPDTVLNSNRLSRRLN